MQCNATLQCNQAQIAPNYYIHDISALTVLPCHFEWRTAQNATLSCRNILHSWVLSPMVKVQQQSLFKWRKEAYLQQNIVWDQVTFLILGGHWTGFLLVYISYFIWNLCTLQHNRKLIGSVLHRTFCPSRPRRWSPKVLQGPAWVRNGDFRADKIAANTWDSGAHKIAATSHLR